MSNCTIKEEASRAGGGRTFIFVTRVTAMTWIFATQVQSGQSSWRWLIAGDCAESAYILRPVDYQHQMPVLPRTSLNIRRHRQTFDAFSSILEIQSSLLSLSSSKKGIFMRAMRFFLRPSKAFL